MPAYRSFVTRYKCSGPALNPTLLSLNLTPKTLNFKH